MSAPTRSAERRSSSRRSARCPRASPRRRPERPERPARDHGHPAKEGTGFLRVQVNDPALEKQGVVPVAIPDSRGTTPIYGHVSAAFAGGIYDVHTYDKTGTPVDAYYIGLELLQTQGG